MRKCRNVTILVTVTAIIIPTSDVFTLLLVTLFMKITEESIEGKNRIIPLPIHLSQNVLVVDDDTMLQDVIKEMLDATE